MSEKINFKEKVGYGFGDFASSMFWKLFSMFLMIYYTDVVEISPASVGTMFLLTRLWDGLNDPIMGIVSDRTKTSMGKFRPYLLWVAIPFGLIGVLTFSTPDLGPSGKLIYAYVTYTLMMMVYTAINVPYSSLMGVMTSDTKERTSLASFRFIGAYSGGIFMTATVPYLLDFFRNSGNDDAQSYQYTVAIYAVLAAFFFIITYKWTKERVKPLTEKSSIKKDIKDLAKNGQWFIMLGAGIAVLIFNSLRDGSIMYYFKYFVHDQVLPVFGEVKWDKLAGAYMTVWLVTNLLGVLLAKPLSAKYGKKNTFIGAMVLASIFSFVFYWVNPNDIAVIFGLNIIIGVTAGIVLPLIWSMYADIADYSEWKTGRRATGLVFSSSSMSQKMGWTLGGAITGWLLAGYGFEANAEQTVESLKGIRMLISIYPAAGALLSAGILVIYKLSDKFMDEITKDLASRRK
ncbi:glycoside/pentoside/hexuronide:cation symporter, GPH family [Lutibacter agarilyticus]|uniref:Glycoside/pentoside/hexuronide:cation symporter, GPH family n=1 Tax=Lutibacter agarilyticus TaxID=1109740 RepID=A0A238WYN3_9FLAO|nr:MFS transporter [Lutibacter agarilyticus]SNR51324.1 glycoside/pentoside/hexuronide:cation symporter, GPH family [Lutibacter agarilyticus]